MSDTFLQLFLKTGLFDIGDSDKRLEWLEQAIGDLQKIFKNDYSLLPKYSLVAIDPNISNKEPVLNDVETIVTNHWKALRGKYPEKPRNILRGVILNALYNVGTDDPIAARVIYLTIVNFYPYAKLNTEKKIVEHLISELGIIAEEHAIQEWAFIENVPSFNLGPLKINQLKFGESKIEADELQPKLKVAIEQEPQGHNCQSHGGNSVWGVHFANHAAEGIVTAINDALNNFSGNLSTDAIENPLNKFFTKFKKNLNANLKTTFASLTAVERRSKLLWWKETLYSHSLKTSYREMDAHILPVTMTKDLIDLLPNITPISVDYLLKDTLFLLNDKKQNPIKFSEYLEAISAEPLKQILKPYFTTLNEEAGKISITDFIGLLIHDRTNTAEFPNQTGISGSDETTSGELAVAILHDTLTHRLLKD